MRKPLLNTKSFRSAQLELYVQMYQFLISVSVEAKELELADVGEVSE